MVAFEYSERVIGGAVVRNDDFILTAQLAQNAVHLFSYEGRTVESGHADGDLAARLVAVFHYISKFYI